MDKDRRDMNLVVSINMVPLGVKASKLASE